MPAETTISTPLPAGVQPSVLVALLHDHEIYIRITCPQLISYTRISPPSSSSSSSSSCSPPSSSSSDSSSDSSNNPNVDEPHTFQVTDRRPTGQTTYRLTLTNRAEGIDSAVDGKVPTGSIAIRSRWRVGGRGRSGDDDDAGLLLLEEYVDVESNMITKKMVKSNIKRSHPAYHRSFLAEAAARAS
ncbi:hypothetical protein F5Y00DRAFT_193100 [Daldinia vernicosa]|uniref:uncharacterized protein n=1 Tax=Daldinia vernicosa TaxID=114800 RepID=UPI0020081D55|nr:uncharacterized protein F5Y00DRAFT_193100 [Daldinia vernicosa]KAI0852320.1 hypothetical protein F5Y00DRAFT_193100 [Daldinia vernicosa]